MSLRKPADFERAGSKVFRTAPVARDSIRGWVDIARGKAHDATNAGISPSTRLGVAYDCVLTLSLAVLNANGWRVTAADGHHKESLEAACAIAGVPISAHDDMDAVRDLRNDQYRGRAPTNEDVALAIRSMETIAPKLLDALGPFLR